MKKLLMFLSLIMVTITMQAQTFYGSGVYLNADPDGAVFDLSNPDLYDGFVLKVREYPSGNVVVDLGAILQSVMSGSTGTYTVQYASYLGIDCSPLTTYSFTYGSYYYVDYYFPSTWQFDYYTHNPFTSLGINLYLYDANDNHMGLYKIGNPSYAHIEYSTHWHCYGTGGAPTLPIPFIKRVNSIYYIQPTWQYEDLFYDHFNDGVGSFMESIDHVKLGVSFRD
jgi:hypothetical protein